MTPFEELPNRAYTVEQYMVSFKVSRAEAEHYRRTALREKRYQNDDYRVFVSQVHVVGGFPPFIHLTIERLDGAPVHSWSDLQTIKNMLVGPEHEAVEVYPAESRLVDMAHQYHLWAFAEEGLKLPIGWPERMVRSELHPIDKTT